MVEMLEMTRRRERLTVTVAVHGFGILPEDAEVLLVHADGIADVFRLAVPIVMPGIEIMDMAEAVATERQGIEELADAILARIEGIAAEGAATGIAVGNDHFSHRGAVHDGAEAAFILIADHVQDQAFADMEADAHLPLLPAHQISFDAEARAFRLGDLQAA